MITAANLTRYNNFTPLEGLGTELMKVKNTLRCSYDFAVQGGAISAIKLLDPAGNVATLPDKAVITQVYIDTITTPTSAGSATIAIGANTATDLKAATAIATYTGVIAGVPVGTGATMVKVTAERQILATVAVDTLTAGKFDVYIDYVLGR